jgi:hypothetical protein
MYLSEKLARDHQSERLKQAREARLGLQLAELQRLRLVQQRAERRLRRAGERAMELRTAMSAES